MHVAERTVDGHRIYAAALSVRSAIVELGARTWDVQSAWQSARTICDTNSPGPASHDGHRRFHAAVVVVRLSTAGAGGEEVFRDEQLEDGQVWSDPELALRFALEVGEAAIRAQARLAEWRVSVGCRPSC
jgi:hypothetical protein